MNLSDDKARFLKEHGLLHPNPTAVLDPLFAHSDFFDPRDLVLVKVEMLRRARTEKSTVTEVSHRFGFSRPVFYEAQRRFNSEGFLGLIPRQRGPRKPHKFTATVKQFLVGQQANPSTLSHNDLAHELKERLGVAVHPRSIERVLHPPQQKKGRKPTATV